MGGEKFRIVAPELVAVQNSCSDRETSIVVNSVLWSGDSCPTQGVLDAVREGQAYVRSGAIRGQQGESSSPTRPVGDTIYIEKRRRPAFLGWSQLEPINVRQ